MPGEKLFTWEEAVALLPRLRPILEQSRDAFVQFRKAGQQLAELNWKVRGNGHGLQEEEIQRLNQVLERLRDLLVRRVEAIRALGAEVKDLELGLVDFPSQREGRVVYLCWQVDEPTIAYWHELDAGYQGRQPL